MKKLLISFFFTISLIAAKSQLTKGNWLVGGSGSFYSYDEDYRTSSSDMKSRYTKIDLSGTVGYFFADKLSAGLRPYFSSDKGETVNGGLTYSYKLAIGPFVRYYFLKSERQFNLLTDIEYLVGINQYRLSLHEHGKFNTFSVMTGIETFFNSAVGLEILLGYRNKIGSINDSPSAYNSNKKGFQASIGFQFHLEKE